MQPLARIVRIDPDEAARLNAQAFAATGDERDGVGERMHDAGVGIARKADPGAPLEPESAKIWPSGLTERSPPPMVTVPLTCNALEGSFVPMPTPPEARMRN
jgi:hypothetical protein